MIIHFPERDDILIFLDFLLFSFRDFGMVITVLPVLSQYYLTFSEASFCREDQISSKSPP